MPQDAKGRFFSEDFLRQMGTTPGPKVPIEETPFGGDPLTMGKKDRAEENASKELGRLAVFLLQNFPEQAGQGKPTVDTVIPLLEKLKANSKLAEPFNRYVNDIHCHDQGEGVDRFSAALKENSKLRFALAELIVKFNIS